MIIICNSQFDNFDIKSKKTETVYICDNCPHKGNNCPNLKLCDYDKIQNRKARIS